MFTDVFISPDGGMFYAIADVRQFKGLELIPEHGSEIARISAMIRQAAHEQLPVSHPDYPVWELVAPFPNGFKIGDIWA